MMSQLSFKLAYEAQTSAAQKVYDAVPMVESWSHPQIIAEMARNGQSLDYRVMAGCLNNLVRAGLVQEVIKGYFRRLPVRPQPKPAATPAIKPAAPIEQVKEPVMTKPAAPITTAAAPTAKQTPMDILGALAVRAAMLGKQAHELSTDIENAALALQEQQETNEKDMEKFRQLQALLKGM